MFRRRRGFRRSAKRSVAWVDGISCMDGATASTTRTVTFSQTGFSVATVWGATIGLVVASDLPQHGGEDAVLSRIRGRLLFLGGRRDSGAGFASAAFPFRLVVAQVASTAAGGATIFSDDFTTSAGLGQDNILYSRDHIWGAPAPGGTGAGFEALNSASESWLELDVKARRKVQVNSQIILWFQTLAPSPGTVAIDGQMAGSLRTLLMRPR